MSEFEGRRPLVLVGDSHLARFNVGRMADLESALDRLVLVHNHVFGGASSADLVERAPLEGAMPGAFSSSASERMTSLPGSGFRSPSSPPTPAGSWKPWEDAGAWCFRRLSARRYKPGRGVNRVGRIPS